MRLAVERLEPLAGLSFGRVLRTERAGTGAGVVPRRHGVLMKGTIMAVDNIAYALLQSAT